MASVPESIELVKQPSANAIWICYRCNLTFQKESIASLHKEISNHSARKIESFQKSYSLNYINQ